MLAYVPAKRRAALGKLVWKGEPITIEDSCDIPEDRGAEYIGHWLAGADPPATRQGRGTLTRTDGSIYIGKFEANRFHGKGELTFGDDDDQGR